ncbi:MAG: FtsQ-type POTRA domain-containing protein [Desulfobacterales bacterium]|nr:FtsQ-type POTRA domain-containing protein [Desulfobacterales bacterium]
MSENNKKIRQNKYTSLKKKKYKLRTEVLLFFFSVLKIILNSFLVVLMTICFIFAYDFITQCQYFNATNIEVSGNKILSTDAIIEIAGLHQGINIFSINLNSIKDNLIENSWIKKVQVKREFPDSIKITIDEEIPIAIIDFIKLENKTFPTKYLVNSDGEIFKENEPNKKLNHLPIITGVNLFDTKIKGSDFKFGKPFKEIMDFLSIVRNQYPEMHKCLKIDADREIGINIIDFKDIKKIKFGYSNYADKINKLNEILPIIVKNFNRGIEKIELKYSNTIIVRPLYES